MLKTKPEWFIVGINKSVLLIATLQAFQRFSHTPVTRSFMQLLGMAQLQTNHIKLQCESHKSCSVILIISSVFFFFLSNHVGVLDISVTDNECYSLKKEFLWIVLTGFRHSSHNPINIWEMSVCWTVIWRADDDHLGNIIKPTLHFDRLFHMWFQ